jgi:hypothetical protein
MSDAEADGSVDAARELVEALTRTIDLARALAEAGRAIDLAGLDGQVGLLCAKSLDLPRAEGHAIRPRLIALSGAIEALSRVLRAHAPPPD